jgi:hypothetical protein
VEITQTAINAVVVAIVGLIVTRMLHGQRVELRAEMAALRSEVKSDIAELRTEFRAEIGELRREIGELRSDVTRVALAVHAEPRTSKG